MMQLLLAGAALVAIQPIIKLVRAMIGLLIRLVASAFVVGFGLVVLVAFASHGKLP